MVGHDRNRRIRDIASGRDRELAKAPGARYDPTWSPDGAHIAATDKGRVVVIDVQSGIMDTVYGHRMMLRMFGAAKAEHHGREPTRRRQSS